MRPAVTLLAAGLAVALLLPAIAKAHPGGLNAAGCHHDRVHGGYHCHKPEAAGAGGLGARGNDLRAEVVAIQDGDTLTVLNGQQQMRVRITEIDAPERAQPWGARSRQALADLCHRVQAQLTVAGKDRYGRTLARVSCKGKDASAEQVRAGMAWVYVRYSKDPALPPLQAAARRERRGLWADPAPVPPWEWRRAK